MTSTPDESALDLGVFEGHTEGDWQADVCECAKLRASDGSMLANFTFLTKAGRRKVEEVFANLRLAAASPELLAEVKRLSGEREDRLRLLGLLMAENKQKDARIAELEKERRKLLGWLAVLEPFLDSVICYASSMDEHPPNRVVREVRAMFATPFPTPDSLTTQAADGEGK